VPTVGSYVIRYHKKVALRTKLMPPQAENLSPEFGLLAGAGQGAPNAMFWVGPVTSAEEKLDMAA
jgi:hypothetical protein